MKKKIIIILCVLSACVTGSFVWRELSGYFSKGVKILDVPEITTLDENAVKETPVISQRAQKESIQPVPGKKIKAEKFSPSKPVVELNGEEGTLSYRWGMDCVSIDETTVLIPCDCYFPKEKLQQKIFYIVETTDFELKEVFRQNSRREFEGIGADQPELLERRMPSPVLVEGGCFYELDGVLYRLSLDFKEATPLCNIRELMGDLYEFSPWVPDGNTCDAALDATRVLACTDEGLYEYDLSLQEKRLLEPAELLRYEITHVEGDCDCGEPGFEFSGPIKAEYAPDNQSYAFVTGTEYGDPVRITLRTGDGNILYQKEMKEYCGDFEWVETENAAYLGAFYREEQGTWLDMINAVTGEITTFAVPDEVFCGTDLLAGFLDIDHLIYCNERTYGEKSGYGIFQLSSGQEQPLEIGAEEVNNPAANKEHQTYNAVEQQGIRPPRHSSRASTHDFDSLLAGINWKMKVLDFGGYTKVIIKIS